MGAGELMRLSRSDQGCACREAIRLGEREARTAKQPQGPAPARQRQVVSNSCFQSSEGSAWRRYFSCRLPLVFGPPPINRRFPKRCTVLFFWNGAFQCCQCGSVAGGRGATTRHNDVKRSSKPYTFDKPSAVTGGRTTFHVCFQVAEPLQ